MSNVSDDWNGAPYIPARPTLYKGIRMRSRLEADYAAKIDREGWEWAYEPECFGSEDGQWLPDFRVDNLGKSAGSVTYIEVKPYGLLDHWRDRGDCRERIEAIMGKMGIARETYPQCALMLEFWGYGGDDSATLLSFPGKPWMVFGFVPVFLQWPDKPVR